MIINIDFINKPPFTILNAFKAVAEFPKLTIKIGVLNDETAINKIAVELTLFCAFFFLGFNSS